MEPAVRFSNVTKQYKSKTAIDQVSFQLDKGTVVSLLGPNGAGKTTAISMMLGLRKPTVGTVRLLGKDPTQPAHRQSIGAMLQQVSMPQKVSVTEIIHLFRSYYRDPLSLDRLLALAGLTGEARSEAAKLSGGQQRRLQFALAMAGNPSVIFLDEPTTGMDVSSRRAFWDSLRQFAGEAGRTIVLTTHHLEEADAISDRILLVQNGRIVADGTPLELKQMTGDSYISFTANPGVDAAALQALDGVLELTWSGRHARIRTRQSDQVLRALILQSFAIHDIQVTQGGLEDAFLSLTANDDTEPAPVLAHEEVVSR